MDLRQLECLLRLYEEGSVTRAARRLNIVQPALSMRIARLEEELGEQLFERSPQGMRPTPSGHRAYEVFSPVLAGFRDAQRSFASRGEAGGGHLTAGFVASVADSVLAQSLARFIARFPAVEVTALEGYSSTLVDWVRAGLLDFAAGGVPWPMRPRSLEFVPNLPRGENGKLYKRDLSARRSAAVDTGSPTSERSRHQLSSR